MENCSKEIYDIKIWLIYLLIKIYRCQCDGIAYIEIIFTFCNNSYEHNSYTNLPSHFCSTNTHYKSIILKLQKFKQRKVHSHKRRHTIILTAR